MWRSRQPFNQPVTSERSERLALTFSADIKQMHSIKMGLFLPSLYTTDSHGDITLKVIPLSQMVVVLLQDTIKLSSLTLCHVDTVHVVGAKFSRTKQISS